jgi:hypothetical protein
MDELDVTFWFIHLENSNIVFNTCRSISPSIFKGWRPFAIFICTTTMFIMAQDSARYLLSEVASGLVILVDVIVV